jgi:hypothetical protein
MIRARSWRTGCGPDTNPSQRKPQALTANPPPSDYALLLAHSDGHVEFGEDCRERAHTPIDQTALPRDLAVWVSGDVLHPRDNEVIFVRCVAIWQVEK